MESLSNSNASEMRQDRGTSMVQCCAESSSLDAISHEATINIQFRSGTA